MLFAVSCTDKANSLDLRLENRPDHIEFLKANSGAIKVAGPYIEEDGEGMTGSLLIVEAADLAKAVAVFTVLTAIASLGPAIRAARLQPVTAIHSIQ